MLRGQNGRMIYIPDSKVDQSFDDGKLVTGTSGTLQQTTTFAVTVDCAD